MWPKITYGWVTPSRVSASPIPSRLPRRSAAPDSSGRSGPSPARWRTATAPRRPASIASARTGRSRRPGPASIRQTLTEPRDPARTAAAFDRCASANIHAYSGASTASQSSVVRAPSGSGASSRAIIPAARRSIVGTGVKRSR